MAKNYIGNIMLPLLLTGYGVGTISGKIIRKLREMEKEKKKILKKGYWGALEMLQDKKEQLQENQEHNNLKKGTQNKWLKK